MGDSSFKQLRPLSKAISQEKALQFISYLSKIIIIIILIKKIIIIIIIIISPFFLTINIFLIRYRPYYNPKKNNNLFECNGNS